MTKEAFIEQLKAGLSGLPEEDIEDRAAFYGEMILDRMDEGLSEEEAVSELGGVAAVTGQIIAETPLKTIVRERVKRKRRLTAFEIVLLIVGSPLWLTMLIVLSALVLTVYIVIWVIVAVLWAAELSLALGGLACIAAAALYLVRGQGPLGLLALGAGLGLGGTAVLFFFACLGATKGMAKLTRLIALGIKKMFIRKENEK